MNELWSERVTANLLTGFLGAGKTTLLKRLLATPDLAETAVLINEFGEVGIDHLLVEEIADDAILLASGCVCCTIRGDLKEALSRLHGRRQRGEVPAFRRLVIETTGLADPAPIVATFAADPMLRHHFRIGNIITVVDAENGLAALDAYDESRRQVGVADRLVVTKTDLAPPERAAALRQRLGVMNPAAEIVDAGANDDVADLLTRDVHDESTRLDEVARWLAVAEPDSHDHDHGDPGHDHASRHDAVRAGLLTAEQPVDWAAFGLWLSMLLNRHGSRILRVKGLVEIAGRAAPLVVQGVQHTIHEPVHLDRWPAGVRGTQIVVIADGIDPALIQRSFAAFVSAGGADTLPLQAALSSA